MLLLAQLGYPKAQMGSGGRQGAKRTQSNTGVGNLRPCEGHGIGLETKVSPECRRSTPACGACSHVLSCVCFRMLSSCVRLLCGEKHDVPGLDMSENSSKVLRGSGRRVYDH